MPSDRFDRLITRALAAVTGGVLVASTTAVTAAAAPAPDPSSRLTAAAPSSPGQPTALTVNGIDTPVDVEGAPHFGWHVGSSRQTAYEVVVATSAASAAEGDGDVWSSGRVDSAQQNAVRYDGPALDPSERYHWTVRSWDGSGTPSAWSVPAAFGTGPGSSWDASTPVWAQVEPDNWTDYVFETDFTVVQNAASVTLRATSTSSFYLWQFRADTNTLKAHVGTTLLEEVPLAPAGVELGTGTTHHLEVRLEGDTITTRVDDKLVDERTDTTFPSGGFGFRTGGSEQATFDDVVVTSLDGDLLYRNDFSSGSAPELASLAVRDDALFVDRSKNDLVPGSWSNYTVDTTLRIDEVAGSIRFRGADANNGYLWQFRADNTLKLHSQVDGNYNNVIKTVDLPAGTLSTGTTVPVRLEVVGPRVRTWIDGELLDTTDTSVNAPSGRLHRRGGIGFRSGGSESATWGPVTVTEANPGNDTVLLDTDFPAGDRTFTCGAVGDGTITIGRGQTCLQPTTSADWAFLRGETTLQDKEIAWATVHATGSSPKAAKQYVYKLYLNGEFVGLGPTIPIAGETRYDGFDVTDLVEPGEDVALGALAYTTAEQKFQAQLTVEYADGTRDVFGTGDSWTGRSGADVLPDAGSIGTSYYRAPKENLDARAYPWGWDQPGFDDGEWDAAAEKSPFATLAATPTDKVEEQLHAPVEIVDKGDGNYFVDFGRTWIGGVRYQVEDGTSGHEVDIRFGETTAGENTVRSNLHTGNSYRDVVTLKDGGQTLETWGARVFRYVEILGAPEPVTEENLQALALVYPFDAEASAFTASDEDLESVYELSKNSIESLNLNFYTDSWTRERINYEADAYLQQMSSMYLMDDLSLARYSMNYFRGNRTWPTEWPIYVILAVRDAWQQTGDTTELADYYPNLQQKLERGWLEESTGLIRKTSGSNGCNSQTDCDIVDWPTTERDGFQFRQYNTVINAIYYRAFRDMAAIAEEIGRPEDATRYSQVADRLRDAVNERLYDEAAGAYDDGMDAEGNRTGHKSVHASAFALAFGVPEVDQAPRVAAYVASRGMACSVYCAAFLVKALHDGGQGQAALDMLTDGTGVRSWLNMIRLGAGSTMEAWDPSLKSNLTFSHPWAASPAFNVPAGVFGIQPTAPGYATLQVKPQPGDLAWATIRTPTVRGSVGVAFETGDGTTMTTSVPGNSVATVSVPTTATGETTVYVDGRARQVEPVDGYAVVEGVGAGCHVFSTEADAEPSDRLLSVCDDAPVDPAVTGSVTGTEVDGWYGADARLALATVDAPPAAVLEYRVGDGAWTEWTAPVALPDGELTVSYRLREDDVVWAEGSLEASVDATAPEVSASVDGRTVTLEATDAGSGVAGLEYLVDDGEWAAYEEPVTLDGFDPGTVSYRATDRVGNESPVGVATVAAVDAPAATEPPSMSGRPVVGERLVADPGTWDTAGVTFGYQWYRDGEPVDGAARATYRVRGRDVGARLTVVVTASVEGRPDGAASSAPTAAVRKRPTATTIRLSRTSLRKGQQVRLVIRVDAGPVRPTGRLRVHRTGRPVVDRRLADGRRVLTFKVRHRGPGKVRVVYLGSANTQRSTSPVVRYTVR